MRPQRFFDLLDGVFRLYRQRWKKIWIILFIILGAPYAVAEVAALRSEDPSNPLAVVDGNGENWLFILLSVVIYLLIGLIFSPLLKAGMIMIASNRLQESPDRSAKEYLKQIGRSSVPVVLTLLLQYLLLGAGWLIAALLWAIPFSLLALAIGGWQIPLVIAGFFFMCTVGVGSLWVSTRLTLTLPIVVDEGISYFPALKRSWQLTKGSFWKIFGLSIIVGIISNIFFMISGGSSEIAKELFLTSSMSWLGVLLTLLSTFLICLPTPLQSILYTLLYFDCRARKEGTDLDDDLNAMGESGA